MVYRKYACSKPTTSWLTESAALQKLLVELRLQELGHADILTQALPAPGLEDKVPGRSLRAGHLQRPRDHVLVERVAGDDVPAVKDEADHGAALGVDAQLRLEAEAVDDGDEALGAVQRRARDGPVDEDVAAAPRQQVVDLADGVVVARHADRVDRLHQPRARHQERAVAGAPRRRDDLPAPAEDGLLRQGDVDEAELGVADGWKSMLAGDLHSQIRDTVTM